MSLSRGKTLILPSKARKRMDKNKQTTVKIALPQLKINPSTLSR
jgi:hypothetical protein